MADKRAAIVGAAIELIGEGGLAAFTQPRVAARAGLRQSHLTYYFPTRDDLLVAVAEEAVRRRVAALREAHDAAADPAGRVAALARLLASPEQTRVLMALTQGADRNEAVRASFGGLATQIAPLGAELLGQWGAAADESSLALLQATSTGLAVLALARGEDFAPFAEHLLRDLLDTAAAATRARAAADDAGHDQAG